MKATLDCIPCLQRQALKAIRMSISDPKRQKEVMREVVGKIYEMDWDKTPPELAHVIHKLIRERSGVDPYRELKERYNKFLLGIYSELEKKVNESNDWIETGIKMAIAGNIIDFGALERFDVEKTIEKVLNSDIGKDLEKFKEKFETARSLLYFFDNAGEIVLDKLLIEKMLEHKNFEKVTFVLKGGPIINDATIEDAKQVGLDKIKNAKFLFVDNGDGAGPSRSSETVKGWIENHDLVIAKGQGNYEGMNEFKNIFFMLMVKCPVISNYLNAPTGTIILKYNK